MSPENSRNNHSCADPGHIVRTAGLCTTLCHRCREFCAVLVQMLNRCCKRKSCSNLSILPCSSRHRMSHRWCHLQRSVLSRSPSSGLRCCILTSASRSSPPLVICASGGGNNRLHSCLESCPFLPSDFDRWWCTAISLSNLHCENLFSVAQLGRTSLHRWTAPAAPTLCCLRATTGTSTAFCGTTGMSTSLTVKRDRI